MLTGIRALLKVMINVSPDDYLEWILLSSMQFPHIRDEGLVSIFLKCVYLDDSLLEGL